MSGLPQNRLFWPGAPQKGSSGAATGTAQPMQAIPTSRLATIVPLKQKDLMALLTSKPVKDWQAAVDFLVSRHLLLLPGSNLFPDSNVVPKNNEGKLEQIAREKRAAAHTKLVTEQKAAAVKRREAKKKVHEDRMKAQEAAKTKRVAAKKLANDSQVAAASKRTTEASAALDLNKIKTGADARRFLETRLEEVIGRSDVDKSKIREASRKIPATVFARCSVRPQRASVKLATLTSSASEEEEKTWCEYQDVVRMVERHLVYVFHENGRQRSYAASVGKAGKPVQA